jgi:general secretion pathway protein C
VFTETLSLSHVVAALSLVGASALAAPPLEPTTFAGVENAPTCADIELRIVTESSDPDFSLATLATRSEPFSRQRRAGDGVGGATLEFIGYNARRMSPAAWFRAEDSTCQALLFEPPAPNRPKAEPLAPSPALPPRSRLRVVPEVEGGKVVGVRLLGISKGGLLGSLGFENGDSIRTVNGFDVTTPEKALQAYARLRTASRVKVELVRRGRPVTIEYLIR